MQEVSAEIVVVDGASQDGTSELARAHPSRPIVTSEPDHGIYDAINKGMALASGRLIGILGSDDLLETGALAKLSALHAEFGTDIVFGRARMVDATGAAFLREDEPYGPNALISGIPFCHNAMFVTPRCFAQVGQYDLSLRICADSEWVN